MCWKEYVFLGIVGLMGLVVSWVVWQDSTGYDCIQQDGCSGRIQRLVGGIGMGSVKVPTWNFHDYDPRLQPVAKDTLYPVPGGYGYSPDRISMISVFPEQ